MRVILTCTNPDCKQFNKEMDYIGELPLKSSYCDYCLLGRLHIHLVKSNEPRDGDQQEDAEMIAASFDLIKILNK